MRTLGLTGGVGSGKSTVARLFRALGAELVDADVIARQVVEPGQPALVHIRDAFGASVLRPDGRLDRAKLGALVFADARARERLNAITHPRIHERMLAEVESRRGRSGLLLLDIPLLFENGREAMVEKVILVWVDAATQLRRVTERDRLPLAEARRRIDAQMPLDDKKSLADDIIDNSGTLDATRAQVDSLYRRYGEPGR